MGQGRLFKIVYHLLDKGRATAPELAEKFEVSVRTIYRDLDAISAAGYRFILCRERAAVFLSCRSLCWRNRC